MNNYLSKLLSIVQTKKKRLGRGLGSRKGAKSGRGTTRHQKARETIPLHFEGGQARLVKRFPLLRGKDRNKPLHQKPFIIGMKQLSSFSDGDKVTVDSLIKKGIVDQNAKYQQVKLLANGQLDKKLTIVFPVSKKAKIIIEKLGGTVELPKKFNERN